MPIFIQVVVVATSSLGIMSHLMMASSNVLQWQVSMSSTLKRQEMWMSRLLSQGQLQQNLVIAAIYILPITRIPSFFQSLDLASLVLGAQAISLVQSASVIVPALVALGPHNGVAHG